MDWLYKQVIAADQNRGEEFQNGCGKGGCFVAGTLVHTKDGLVLIENIRVGDWVLSQPEGRGELAYKRVVDTFQFEDKAVWSVSFFAEGSNDPEGLVVTGEHPFWKKGVGWTRADEMSWGSVLELADGRSAKVFSVREIYQTDVAAVGWAEDLIGSNARLTTPDGGLIDFRQGAPRIDYNAPEVGLEGPSGSAEWGGALMGMRVYNFEVEDFHTYYVGNSGIWVHTLNADLAPTHLSVASLDGKATASGERLP